MTYILKKFSRCARENIEKKKKDFFLDLMYLRRARFRHENRIFFSSSTHLTENPAKSGRIFFDFKVFKPKKKDFFYRKNPKNPFLKGADQIHRFLSQI